MATFSIMKTRPHLRTVFAPLVAVVALSLSACSGDSGGGSGTVDMSIRDVVPVSVLIRDGQEDGAQCGWIRGTELTIKDASGAIVFDGGFGDGANGPITGAFQVVTRDGDNACEGTATYAVTQTSDIYQFEVTQPGVAAAGPPTVTTWNARSGEMETLDATSIE